ncbi:hypothetical protein HOG48_03135 [Candidatus Peregrinibacteria bacterium]|jgi:hypothetical protein|nr:hypothetical protein [Candidatus Peregrinibacteria bacterium]
MVYSYTLAMGIICSVSGEKFTISDHEMALREKFGFGDSFPEMSGWSTQKQTIGV